MNTTQKRYDINTVGVRSKFEKWIAERGGVLVWESADFGTLGRKMFTPSVTEDGKRGVEFKPHWSMVYAETATDISRFRFQKSAKEVKRFKVGARVGSQGMTLKVTDGGTRKIRAACAKAGPDSFYEFDYETQEAVVYVPEWED